MCTFHDIKGKRGQRSQRDDVLLLVGVVVVESNSVGSVSDSQFLFDLLAHLFAVRISCDFKVAARIIRVG